MPKLQPAVGQHVFVPRTGLRELVSLLRRDGYTVVGPTVHQGTIALRPIDSADQLARGVRDEQSPGKYRLTEGDPELQFQYVVGAESLKQYLFPPSMRLFKLHVKDGMFKYESGPPVPPKVAVVGVRPCEVAALKVMDRVFSAASRCESDPYFNRARQQLLVVAVNCTRPGGNCFCASMGTGPQAKDGCDLAMTELRGGFVVKVGSARGAQLASQLDVREPSSAEMELAEVRTEQAREHMGRRMVTKGLRELLEQAIEHPHWDEVAKRCMACGNCTMVCPTCFCSSVVDCSDLTGTGASRMRFWESCHTHQFSYTTAGPIRSTIRARYRHWLRHKLGTFWDQFGCSGCVGCGRCITWCPAGIDLTEEVAALQHAAADGPVSKTESEVEL